MIQRLRAASLAMAGLLAAATLWQTFKASQPILYLLSDFLMAGLLVAATVVIYKDSTRRRALMAGSWGLVAGKFSSIFLTRLMTLSYSGDAMLTTFAVGVISIAALTGLTAALLIPRER